MTAAFHQTPVIHLTGKAMTANVISVIEFKNYSLLRISGKDRGEFLQGQLTQDLDALRPERSALTGWTTAKGRLLFVGPLLDWNEAIYIPVSAGIADQVARRLNMFVLRADVQIDSPDMRLAGLIMDNSDAFSMDAIEIPEGSGACSGDDSRYLARMTGDPTRLWAIGTAQAIGNICDATQMRAADEVWTLSNIRAGIPEIEINTSEMYIPQMVNLDLLNGVSFTKGCYVGQEIIARTQNLGRIKRRMYRFRIEADEQLESGGLLYGPDNATGKIVSWARDGDATELLAVIAMDASDSGWFADEARTVPLKQQPLPYEVPDQR
jgi:folate-binding protein YgfZ